ncbi:uncharacterized protein LOC109503651 [Harpegnathos saltator]|uniref:uncharacterized protein LOC109503651 n=1 Tax=Harpegnathos saltator TaxID=610380 RepID=UPI000948AD3E|nr:uncharacterized protein LOC109503651 [Harpegnathos saltator]
MIECFVLPSLSAVTSFATQTTRDSDSRGPELWKSPSSQHRIRKELTAKCHHCPVELKDTAQHTLERCSAWIQQHHILARTVRGVEPNLSSGHFQGHARKG